MSDRTTKELIEKLGNDIDRCHAALLMAIDAGEVDPEGLIDAEYEFEARQLIRSIFAYIEAVTFSAKVSCVLRCLEQGIDVTDYERYLAVELVGELNDKGDVTERPARLRLAQNVRFAFKLLEKLSGMPTRFNSSDEWWQCFKRAIRVRDRLMHPRMAEDIDIGGNEILDVLKARNGFNYVLMAGLDDKDSESVPDA
jgi:hypothetical protein